MNHDVVRAVHVKVSDVYFMLDAMTRGRRLWSPLTDSSTTQLKNVGVHSRHSLDWAGSPKQNKIVVLVKKDSIGLNLAHAICDWIDSCTHNL